MMGASAGQGSWLVPLADLAMILFIITGSAISPGGDAPHDTPAAPYPLAAPAEGVATAFYLDGPDAPSLTALLDRHIPGEGEQLTIAGYYAPADRERVLQRTEALAQQAIASGVEPRIVVAASPSTHVFALFANDAGS